jgi:hypothetical protein
MKVQQIYTGCIAHAAYYLESNGKDVIDGMAEIAKTNVPKTAYVCPSTLL